MNKVKMKFKQNKDLIELISFEVVANTLIILLLNLIPGITLF